MSEARSTYGERRCTYRVLVGKTGRKKSFGRPRRRWENNIKTDLKEVEWRVEHGLDWSGLEHGHVAGSWKCINGNSGSLKYGEFLD